MSLQAVGRIAVRALAMSLLLVSGCYAPLHSPGIAASSLPDSFRFPTRSLSTELNYAMLTQAAPPTYILGPDDVILVEISDLVPRVRRLPPPNGENRVREGPFSYKVEAHVAPAGDVVLPLVGATHVSGMTLEHARQQIVDAYRRGILDEPRVAVSLVQKSLSRVMITGDVARPDVYELPKFENDIAHAIVRAGGLLDTADEIQVHRRVPLSNAQKAYPPTYAPDLQHPLVQENSRLETLRIPLRSDEPVIINTRQAVLNDGDVVVVRSRPDEVFFVVGRLNPTNLVRFSLGRDNRDLGNGFVLPKDRDINVVTAVAMAGYIDPIDSPTTVTVHRTRPDGEPMLIHVDLIAARSNSKENIMVQSGDIIYLNPDGAWWLRRTIDRVLPELIVFPYERAILTAFGQERR